MQAIRRDPFARQELSRETAPAGSSCKWCGSKPQRLYCYTLESDGGRKSRLNGEFCNLDCFDSYHT